MGGTHWILCVSSEPIRANVTSLYAGLKQLMPAFMQSWSEPPFEVEHKYTQITREWLADRVADITTLELEDNDHYYLIAVNNSGVIKDVTFRMRLANMQSNERRAPRVLNEGWPMPGDDNRMVRYDAQTQQWVIPKHTMIFGDVNIWVILKRAS